MNRSEHEYGNTQGGNATHLAFLVLKDGKTGVARCGAVLPYLFDREPNPERHPHEGVCKRCVSHYVKDTAEWRQEERRKGWRRWCAAKDDPKENAFYQVQGYNFAAHVNDAGGTRPTGGQANSVFWLGHDAGMGSWAGDWERFMGWDARRKPEPTAERVRKAHEATKARKEQHRQSFKVGDWVRIAGRQSDTIYRITQIIGKQNPRAFLRSQNGGAMGRGSVYLSRLRHVPNDAAQAAQAVREAQGPDAARALLACDLCLRQLVTQAKASELRVEGRRPVHKSKTLEAIGDRLMELLGN